MIREENPSGIRNISFAWQWQGHKNNLKKAKYFRKNGRKLSHLHYLISPSQKVISFKKDNPKNNIQLYVLWSLDNLFWF